MFKKLKILDGGLGSTLQMMGHDINSNPLFSAYMLHVNPEAILEVHSAFINSGASILITASYQASVDGFKKYLSLTEEESLELIKKSVHLARESSRQAGKDDVLVAGSVGPYGACQGDGSEYNGNYMNRVTAEQLMEWHKPRIEALLSSGVDFLAVETFPALEEALTVLKLLKGYPEAKCWVTFTCKDENSTCFGDDFASAVKKCYEENPQQLVAIGINCTDPSYITPLLSRVQVVVPANLIPRVIYPNSGEIWTSEKKWEGDANIFTKMAKNEYTTWLKLGVKIIGGCCRVTPSQIQKISELVHSHH